MPIWPMRWCRAFGPKFWPNLPRKYGAPPGRGAVVLGMGSLGAGRLNAGSDLDLIVIYDAQGVESSDGKRPLATRPYYARLTQALVTALTAPMPEGKLYEVDMRLRPSGRQGPVATSIDAFKSYQLTEAWTWEHLALTRARPIAGNAELGAEVEAFRAEVFAAKGQGATVLSDVADMRLRLQAAKPALGSCEAKNGAGRLMDIELLAQTAALRSASPSRRVEAQLRAGVKGGFLSQSDETLLLDAYRLCWRVQAGTRLLTEGTLDMDKLGEGGRAFLVRETGEADAPSLGARLDHAVQAAAEVISARLGAKE